MKIETKFDLHQEVWFLKDNKVQSGEVSVVQVTVRDRDQFEERWFLYEVTGHGQYSGQKEPDNFFLSKTELLASL